MSDNRLHSPSTPGRGIRRRDALRLGALGVAGAAIPGLTVGGHAYAATASLAAVAQGVRLMDPADQPMFVEPAPNALAAPFKYAPGRGVGNDGVYVISTERASHQAGLVNPRSGKRLTTTIYGYGSGDYGPTWPGRTLDINKNDEDMVRVRWDNQLYGGHILPVDTSLHWCYALPGYTRYTLESDGVPMVPHVHGGHTDFQFDGNPEFFFSPDGDIVGPSWDLVDGGFTNQFTYDLTGDEVKTGAALWYHDHALGITRLNVYAGLAGFFFVRDEDDTGVHGTGLGLPGHDPDTGNLYEAAFAIQDRFFSDKGELFYPAFPGDPAYEDFITGEGAVLPRDRFPKGGPTALAEFFGDHMVVNGKIWPVMDVEPRSYRLRLLNGCDSRFLAVEFWHVPAGQRTLDGAEGPLEFTVIGSDQGLVSAPTPTETLLIETGSRYDIVVDFADTDLSGRRVIMKNIGGDEPFGGEIPGPQVYDRTDRIMAFDVLGSMSSVSDVTLDGVDFSPFGPPNADGVDRTRKVALFEGKDEFGRLQPLLGTAEPAKDWQGNDIDWPATAAYSDVGLSGPMVGSIAWHSPTTENPKLDDTEEWEIWNMTGDAHPVHLHLVNFEILGRQEIKFDSNVDDDGVIDGDDPDDPGPAGDGAYKVSQPVVQHNTAQTGLYGTGFRIEAVSMGYGDVVDADPEYVENAPKDMVTALPGQITRIRATFDKPGRYVWHCHILSHEDHEMMRVLEVTEE